MARFHLDLSAIPALNTTGVSLSGAKLDVFLSETTTRTSSWSAASGGSANANPVVANSSGRFPPVYLDADVNYRIRMTNSAGTDTMFDRNDINVSALPAGVATYAVLAGTGGAALIGTADGGTVQSWLTSNAVPNRVALAALPTADEKTVFLAEAGREGFFKFDVADYSAQVTADPEQGLYVAPASDTDGSTGAWVRVVPNGIYEGSWWGLTSATVDPQDIINGALQSMPEYSTFRLPVGDFVVDYAANGTVEPGSSSVNGGIIGAIYIDKEGTTFEGRGYDSHIDGDGGLLNCIIVRASHCRIRRIRAGNVSGQLLTNEAAAISFCPSNFVQGSGVGADIEDLIVEDCDLYDCESGVTSTPEMDLAATPDLLLWLSTKCIVRKCRMSGIVRQGVELFQSSESRVVHNTIAMTDRGANSFNRAVRIIGASRVHVTDNLFLGHDGDTGGYLGIEVSTSGYYGDPLFYELAGDVIVSNNIMFNFVTHIEIFESRGVVRFANNICINDAGTATNWCLRVLTNGIRDPSGSAVDLANKTFADVVEFQNNTVIGIARCCDVVGRTLTFRQRNNLFISNSAASPFLTSIQPTAGNANDRVPFSEIEGNVSITPPDAGAASSVILISGLNASDVVYIDRNKLTPDVGGATITQDGTGTIVMDHPDSNTVLPHGHWAAYYDPPAGPL